MLSCIQSKNCHPPYNFKFPVLLMNLHIAFCWMKYSSETLQVILVMHELQMTVCFNIKNLAFCPHSILICCTWLRISDVLRWMGYCFSFAFKHLKLGYNVLLWIRWQTLLPNFWKSINFSAVLLAVFLLSIQIFYGEFNDLLVVEKISPQTRTEVHAFAMPRSFGWR